MGFLIASSISGLLMIIAVLAVKRIAAKKLGLTGKIFWKAGLTYLLFLFFSFSVLDGLMSYWPEYENASLVMQAVVAGLGAGVILELGRFIVLDKLFKKVRTFNDAINFGIGWSGLATLLLGFILIAGSISTYWIYNTPDLSVIAPDAGPEQIEQLEKYKELAETAYNESWLNGLNPLVERASILFLDVFLTMFIVLGIKFGRNYFTWGAVLIHSAVIFVLAVASSYGPFLIIPLWILFGILFGVYAKKLKVVF
ncbi:YhfC family intramembrane metalloprotease [Candidatus Peregrinibacteria bacterium]|nr:YhfC family intramembrane metalloprotease [Candidatus Peregrinibacteria bacterium]